MDGGSGRLVDGGRIAKSFMRRDRRDDDFFNGRGGSSHTFKKPKHWADLQSNRALVVISHLM
jgi:hypothetical protein